MEKSKQEGVNLGYLFISLFSCFCDFYHLYFTVRTRLAENLLLELETNKLSPFGN